MNANDFCLDCGADITNDAFTFPSFNDAGDDINGYWCEKCVRPWMEPSPIEIHIEVNAFAPTFCACADCHGARLYEVERIDVDMLANAY